MGQAWVKWLASREPKIRHAVIFAEFLDRPLFHPLQLAAQCVELLVDDVCFIHDVVQLAVVFALWSRRSLQRVIVALFCRLGDYAAQGVGYPDVKMPALLDDAGYHFITAMYTTNTL